MKRISNILAVLSGASVSVLFVVLFSQSTVSDVESSLAFSLLLMLIGGILLLICGIVGLLSQRITAFICLAIVTAIILLSGFFMSNHYIVFSFLSVVLIFVFFANLRKRKEKEPD